MKKILSILWAILTTMSLQIVVNGVNYDELLNTTYNMSYVMKKIYYIQYFWNIPNLLSIIMVIVLYYLYSKIILCTINKTYILFSLIGSLGSCIGFSFTTNNSLWLFKEPILLTILLIGNIGSFYILAFYFVEIVSNIEYKDGNSTNVQHLWKNMLLLGICWLPYYIVFFPGNIFPDGMDQLNKYFGYAVWTKHHPPLSTIFMGLVVSVGQKLWNDNLGLGIYVFIQLIITIYTFAKILEFIGKRCDSKIYNRIIIVFYCIYTVWPSYAICMIKDTLFLDFVILFYLNLWNVFIYKYESMTIQIFIKLLVYGSLVCLLRNNGIYLIIATIPYLLLKRKISSNRTVVMLGGIIVIYFLFNGIIYPSMGIIKGGTQESLSIPFQQTARYISIYDNEVTDYERNVIDNVLDYDQIKENYNPNISDRVKGTYHWAYDAAILQDGEEEALNAYFKVWMAMFFKHPLCYIEATLNNTYEYFYIDATSKYSNTGYYKIVNDPTVDIGVFDFSYIFNMNPFRDIIEGFSEVMRRIPAVGTLYGTGIYDIVFLLILFIYISKKDIERLLMLLPFLILVMTCIASPVNGAIRYLLPLVAMMPIIILIFSMDIGFKYKINRLKQ